MEVPHVPLGGGAVCCTFVEMWRMLHQRVVTYVVIPPLPLNAREVCAEKLAVLHYFDTPPQTVALCRGLIVCVCLCMRASIIFLVSWLTFHNNFIGLFSPRAEYI